MRPLSEDELIYLIQRSRPDLSLNKLAVRDALRQHLSPDGGDLSSNAYSPERVLEILNGRRLRCREATIEWVEEMLADLLTFEEAAKEFDVKEYTIRNVVREAEVLGYFIRPVVGYASAAHARRNTPTTRRWRTNDLRGILR